jgi:hypothetical protein
MVLEVLHMEGRGGGEGCGGEAGKVCVCEGGGVGCVSLGRQTLPPDSPLPQSPPPPPPTGQEPSPAEHTVIFAKLQTSRRRTAGQSGRGGVKGAEEEEEEGGRHTSTFENHRLPTDGTHRTTGLPTGGCGPPRGRTPRRRGEQ